ncbi:MAG: phospho-sugar mutase [Clostridiales bacterium]|nr:phospho-sugar mutase [Candidatus Cacconaster stercorequi]
MTYKQEYEKWLCSDALSAAEKAELEAIAGDEKEIESRFYGPLEFGTAGLRGTMKVGLHQMNIHVIRWATQGFANVICAEGEDAKRRGVAICMDCRLHSMEFARAAAEVCAANGIHVRMFEGLRPTPELSFAVREYGCQAGINVTASHNPKEYNGYKVYWADGAQLPPHHADAIARELENIDIFTGVKRMPFIQAVNENLVDVMGAETDDKFMAHVMAMVNDRETVAKVADTFKMVYTPFHGCGWQLVPQALTGLGIKHLYCVPEQMVLDGNFPTVVSPNPENPEGFYLAVALADKVGADFILGTDPDSDRVGLMVRDHGGKFVPLTGNQTGVLMLDYLIGAMRRAGKMPENPVMLKTIVTTEMARRVAEANGVTAYDTFTGFKFMAEKKNALESTGQGKVIMSYEESYGYMLGDFVRDKDAVTASLILTEMAAWYAAQGMTLFDALEELYKKYGWYGEKTHNLVMPGLDGLEKMAALMKHLREEPPAQIAGVKVAVRKDYADGSVIDCVSGEQSTMELSGSNVLRYELMDGTTILVRPSGTEPKIKVYVLTIGADAAERDANLEKYGQWVATLA